MRFEVGFPKEIPVGLLATYTIINSTNLDPTTTDFTGTAITYDKFGWTYASWLENDLHPTNPYWSATVRIEVSGCSIDLPVDVPVDVSLPQD